MTGFQTGDHSVISANGHIPGSGRLPATLDHAFAEIASMLSLLQSSRDALERATGDDFRVTTEKLEEVTSATEVAATGLLDGLDRALQHVDRLEALDTSGAEDAAEARTLLRDEIFQSMGHLQFQDITSQQLRYTIAVLRNLEVRLTEVRHNFDLYLSGTTGADAQEPAGEPSLRNTDAFDPDATYTDASERQALADELLRARDQ